MRLSSAQFFQNGLDQYLKKQFDLSITQQKISSGKRILSAADDPTGTIDAANLKRQLANIEQFKKNADLAENNLALQDTIFNNINTVIQRVREVAIQAGNPALSTDNRLALGVELRERYDELLNLANSKNTQGEYLFSGFLNNTQPFTKNGTGTVSYNGDQGQRTVSLSAGVQVPVTTSGYEAFVEIPNGNGVFATAHNSNNSGTGVIDAGSVININQYVDDIYTITIEGANANGDLSYSISGATSGQVVPALPGAIPADAPAFIDGASIEFSGIQVKLTGTPEVGDSFTVSPSQSQNILDTVNNTINVIEQNITGDTDQANYQNGLNRIVTDIDQIITKIQNSRAKIGTRLNTVDNVREFNEQSKLSSKELLSKIEDVDIAEAISKLNQETVALQVAQQSFVRIQQLSLFNFLS